MVLSEEAGRAKSDRWIAEHVGVSGPFVAKIRRETGANVCTSRAPREGKDGKVYPALSTDLGETLTAAAAWSRARPWSSSSSEPSGKFAPGLYWLRPSTIRALASSAKRGAMAAPTIARWDSTQSPAEGRHSASAGTSFASAVPSICRMRSLVTPRSAPISSSVMPPRPARSSAQDSRAGPRW